MENKISRELALHRLEQSKEDILASEMLYNGKLYKSANSNCKGITKFSRKICR